MQSNRLIYILEKFKQQFDEIEYKNFILETLQNNNIKLFKDFKDNEDYLFKHFDDELLQRFFWSKILSTLKIDFLRQTKYELNFGLGVLDNLYISGLDEMSIFTDNPEKNKTTKQNIIYILNALIQNEPLNQDLIFVIKSVKSINLENPKEHQLISEINQIYYRPNDKSNTKKLNNSKLIIKDKSQFIVVISQLINDLTLKQTNGIFSLILWKPNYKKVNEQIETIELYNLLNSKLE